MIEKFPYFPGPETPHRGVLSAYLTPDMPMDELLKWWRSLTKRERERYLVYRHENMILAAGKSAFIQSGINSTTLKYFAIGTGTFSGAVSTDTALPTEQYRQATGTFTYLGNQVTVETVFDGTHGNYTYTCAGLFGGSASGTANSGTLECEAPYVLTKTSANSLFNDWVFDCN